MLSSLSLRAKLFLLAFLGVAGTTIVGGIGFVALGQSIATADGLNVGSAAQRSQMEADMMHDAIRSDVYSALLAAQTANDKRRARLSLIRHVLGALDYPGKDKKAVGSADPLILGGPGLLAE